VWRRTHESSGDPLDCFPLDESFDQVADEECDFAELQEGKAKIFISVIKQRGVRFPKALRLTAELQLEKANQSISHRSLPRAGPLFCHLIFIHWTSSHSAFSPLS
jgi:hypothetical protein